MRTNEQPTVTAVSRDGQDIVVELDTVIEVREDGSPLIGRKQTVRVPLAFAKTFLDLARAEPEKIVARYICVVCGDTATHYTTANEGMRRSTYWCTHHLTHIAAHGAMPLPDTGAT
jgi:hypothetical protein